MGRRGTRRQAIGVILLVLAGVLVLSFLPKATGIPLVLGRMQRALLGEAAPLMPLYVFFAGGLLALAGSRARFTRRIVAILIATLTGLTAYHVLRVPSEVDLLHVPGLGSGAVGGAVVWTLRRLFGEVGLWFVLVVAGIASGVLWSGGSFVSLVEFVWISLVGVGRAASAGGMAVGGLLARVVGTTVHQVGVRLFTTLTAIGHMLLGTLGLPRLGGGLEPASEVAELTRGELGREPAVSVEVPLPVEGAPPPPALVASPAPGSRQGENAVSSPVPPYRQESLELEVPSGGYELPPLSLLADLPATRTKGRADPAEVAKALEHTLLSFGVEAKVIRWEQGPVVTRFEVQPASGVRVQKISSLTNDIALGLAAPSVRIEAPIPGKSAVGIELPNQKTSLVHIKDILVSEENQRVSGQLTVALGQDIAGHPILADLAEMPHLLIAGATGSGKSVMLNAIIASLLFRCTPRDVRFVMIDPKRVEFANYNAIPHLLAPVVTNPRAAAGALKEMLREMEERFERFASTGTRNIQAYNQLPDVEPLSYVVIVIDELADLMMVAPADFEDVICRLAQMTRATGIHLVVATQRPSVDVVTGLIKANIPSRIAFAVSSQVDSRTILDMPGAEKLLGKGDMLFMPIGAARPVRAQGSFIADSEIQALVGWWKAQGKPVFDRDLVPVEKSEADEDPAEDALLAEAAQVIVRAGYGSVSLLQRKMKIGYVRAARIIDQLEERGIVGPAQGSNPREVLVGSDGVEALVKR